MTDAAPPADGTLFAKRYRVVQSIGAGGMGQVFEVVDELTNRRRALKVMLPAVGADADLIARFHREATITGRVESDHLVEIIDAGVDEEKQTPFLVMELLRGRDLAMLLDERGRLQPEEVILFLSQVALGLDRTHNAGIVHRDLKLENLFVTHRDDGSPHIKILDFGIAKAFAGTQQKAKTTKSIGTPLFMAPEQLDGSGEVDGRADLYALAHIAYALLVGTPYWELDLQSAKSVYSFAFKVLAGLPEPATERARRSGAELPPAFDEWFARGTALIAADRFDCALLQIAALSMALNVAPTFVPSAFPPPAHPPFVPASFRPLGGLSFPPPVRASLVSPSFPAPPAMPDVGVSIAANEESPAPAGAVDHSEPNAVPAPASPPSDAGTTSRARWVGFVLVASIVVVASIVLLRSRNDSNAQAIPSGSAPATQRVETHEAPTALPNASMGEPSPTPSEASAAPVTAPRPIDVRPPTSARPRSAPSHAPSSTSRPKAPYDPLNDL